MAVCDCVSLPVERPPSLIAEDEMMTTRSPCVMLTATLTKGHLKIEQARPVAELFQQRCAGCRKIKPKC